MGGNTSVPTVKAYVTGSGEILEVNQAGEPGFGKPAGSPEQWSRATKMDAWKELDRSRVIKASSQLPEGQVGWEEDAGLVEPPYNPRQLALLVERNTWHYACCAQKAHDVAGLGWQIRPIAGAKAQGWPEARAEAADLGRLHRFFAGCNPRMSLREVLYSAQFDYESTGWMAIEVVRDSEGTPRELWHVPAHTVRVHASRPVFCQLRGERQVWFKEFGEPRTYRRSDGKESAALMPEHAANEMIFIKSYFPMSSYYGVPAAIPALGALIGELEAREYNLRFFENHAIPAYAVIVEGGDLDEDSRELVRRYFRSEVRRDPHKTLILSSPTGVTIRLEKLNADVREGSFRFYRKDNRDEVIAAHRVPPYRLGIAETGSLGGNTSRESTEIYKTSVVKPRQETLEDRLNRLIREGFGIEGWEFKFDEIDTRDEVADVEKTSKLFAMGAISPNEVRARLAIGEPYQGGDRYFVSGRTKVRRSPAEEELVAAGDFAE